ncbi:MAG: hypothetical protein FH749_08265 [Firmicutes bacterium]|nr:hypothetical protein [Bacillota bacterium]
MKNKTIVVSLVFLLLIGGAVIAGNLMRDLTGTMTYVELEGGFWAVESGDELYIPTNLDDEYMKEGLVVSFKVVERPDMVGIHMSGTYVEIIDSK